MPCGGPKSLPLHHIYCFLFCILHFLILCDCWVQHFFFGNRVSLNPGLGVREGCRMKRLNQTECCFQTLYAVFPKDLFGNCLVSLFEIGSGKNHYH